MGQKSGCRGDVPLPSASPLDGAEAARQQQAFVDAMKPRRGGKPVVAVVAFDAATDTTDFPLGDEAGREYPGRPACGPGA